GHPLDALDVLAAQRHRAPREHPAGVAHALEIPARVERAAGPRQHDAAHLVVGLGRVEGPDQALHHGLAVGVVRIGTVEGHERELSVALVAEIGQVHAAAHTTGPRTGVTVGGDLGRDDRMDVERRQGHVARGAGALVLVASLGGCSDGSGEGEVFGDGTGTSSSPTTTTTEVPDGTSSTSGQSTGAASTTG